MYLAQDQGEAAERTWRASIIAAPAVVVRRPSCMELFDTDEDRGEGACGTCKRCRYIKPGVPIKERYSQVPKPGYVDKKGTHAASCRHDDGPNGRGR